MLVDSLGRVHTSLRISVTDRCNIRCFYCMPDQNLKFKPRSEILTFEEIERFVRVVAKQGVNRLRITGGEPLVRAQLPELVRRLVSVTGIEEVAMTTNGVLLAEHARPLRQAGLSRINVSLDGLHESTFRSIARRSGLEKVLAGIFAARHAGFDRIRLNAVSIQGISEREILPLGQFARDHDFEVRFIEFMPLDAEQNWSKTHVLSGENIRQILEQTLGRLIPLPRTDDSQPAKDYQFEDGRGRIGFINPVTQPFCGSCNRLRITAEGQLRNCLFSTTEWDMRAALRAGQSDDKLLELVRSCVADKKPGHGIDSFEFVRPERAMYQIGG